MSNNICNFSEAGQTGANPRSPLTYENLLQEFIVNLGVNMLGGNGNMQLFLNPGDYAWGREGLDAIVTQLLNQIDTTGIYGDFCVFLLKK